MKPRFDVKKHLGAKTTQALFGLSQAVEQSGLEHSLLELVKIRASQINGCAYCLDMHTKDARAMGETEQRIYALNVWRETPFFTPRERAALEWAESLTRISETHVPDATYEAVRPHFSEDELVSLTFAVIVINSWNRLAISSGAVAGTYQRQETAVAV
jgi:AhpD family alkylhydroperoxidase